MSDKKTTPMTKAELRQMLADAVRNTQPENIGTSQPELPREEKLELHQKPISRPKKATKRNAAQPSARRKKARR